MGTLIFKESDVRACLAKAVEISQQYEMYALNGHGFPKSCDQLAWICGEYLGKKVRIDYVDVPAEGSSIKAAFWAMDDGSYRIGVLTGMSEDELRFVLCKELFHVIFDEESRRSLDLGGHVEEYTSTLPLDGGTPNCAAAWETLATIAAIEFLFPLAVRKTVAVATDGSPVNFAKLAALYGIPRYYVEVACGEGNMAYIEKHLQAG
jgi:Zn-dependent peptidase ImmA (M78 family)